jgi:hypothetical protein
VDTIEQLNIEGKRSGDGFIAHKATLVSALSRALADRVTLIGLTVGRRGLLAYLKALKGSNMVKVTPSNGVDSGSHDTAKRVKVVCGGNIGFLADDMWVKEASVKGKTARGGTPYTFCEVRVSPKNTVKPNMGVSEFAEALSKVLPFTATDDTRPILACVKFEAKEGKLRLVSADGFRLAILDLDYEGEGEALINRLDLKGVANALKRAKRLAVSFETGEHNNVVLDTELVRYRWPIVEGSYPDYNQLIPSESKAVAHFDTTEAIQALGSLKALANAKAFAVDVFFSKWEMTLSNVDGKGRAEVTADCEGEGIVRLDGSYLSQILRACGGAVDMTINSPQSPVVFSSDGFRVVTMPMFGAPTPSQPAEAVAEAEGATDVVAQAEAVANQAEAVAEGKGKPKGKRKAKAEAKAKAKGYVDAEQRREEHSQGGSDDTHAQELAEAEAVTAVAVA